MIRLELVSSVGRYHYSRHTSEVRLLFFFNGELARVSSSDIGIGHPTKLDRRFSLAATIILDLLHIRVTVRCGRWYQRRGI